MAGPGERDAEQVPPVSAYSVGDAVWVWRHGSGWLRGEVLAPGLYGVMVRYQLTGRGGTTNDTVMPDRLAPRAAMTEPGS